MLKYIDVATKFVATNFFLSQKNDKWFMSHKIKMTSNVFDDKYGNIISIE